MFSLMLSFLLILLSLLPEYDLPCFLAVYGFLLQPVAFFAEPSPFVKILSVQDIPALLWRMQPQGDAY